MFFNLMSLLLPQLLPSRLPQCLAAAAVALLAATTAHSADGRASTHGTATQTVEKSTGNAQQSASADALVKLVAQRKLWPLKAETVEEQLRALGPWKREQPIPEALTLVAGCSGAVARSEISYAAAPKKRWAFVGASFFVADSDLPRLYQALSDLIQKELGKPRWTRKKAAKGELPAAGWKLGKHLELLLRQSPVEGENLIAIMISEPQGGPGD
jgi:hypothetical protein